MEEHYHDRHYLMYLKRAPNGWSKSYLPDSSGWKKKQRSEQFPILERHVVEWVDRANLKRVQIR